MNLIKHFKYKYYFNRMRNNKINFFNSKEKLKDYPILKKYEELLLGIFFVNEGYIFDLLKTKKFFYKIDEIPLHIKKKYDILIMNLKKLSKNEILNNKDKIFIFNTFANYMINIYYFDKVIIRKIYNDKVNRILDNLEYITYSGTKINYNYFFEQLTQITPNIKTNLLQLENLIKITEILWKDWKNNPNKLKKFTEQELFYVYIYLAYNFFYISKNEKKYTVQKKNLIKIKKNLFFYSEKEFNLKLNNNKFLQFLKIFDKNFYNSFLLIKTNVNNNLNNLSKY